MSRHLISSDSPFEKNIGYSRAVVSGPWVFVSGTTGYNYATSRISDDVVEQCDQAFKNIHAALKEAGADMKDVVRVHYLLPDRNDFEPCWPVLQKRLGDVRPAATMTQTGLMEEVMKIEIEVTAHVLR